MTSWEGRHERLPVVTATRSQGRDRVAVELDGAAWRVVPLMAAIRAGIGPGITLDRERARALNRALREAKALETAARLLRYADHSTATLDARLTDRGVAVEERRVVVETLASAGVLDDARFARRRADVMVARGYGNAAIDGDLRSRGLAGELVHDVVAELEPERLRVRRMIERRGASVGTLAFLARRGFSEEALESVVACVEANGLG